MENDRMTAKTMQIRNSTVDFLVFTKQNSQDSIEVRVQDENVWLTQEGISRLFDKGRSTITEHLNAIFAEQASLCRKRKYRRRNCLQARGFHAKVHWTYQLEEFPRRKDI